MHEPIVNIANILSAVFLVLTLAALILAQRKKRNLQGVILFYLGSFVLLLLVSVTNLLEHFEISAYIDYYEDSLEILFIPFMMFAIYSSRLKQEYPRRIKAELFSSQVLKTSPAITFLFNLPEGKFTYLNGRLKNFSQEKNSDPDAFLRSKINPDDIQSLIHHFESIRSDEVELTPSPLELCISLSQEEKRNFQIHTSVFTREESGYPKEIVGIAMDITDMKIIEEQLLLYKNHLEQLVKERTNDLENTNEELKSTNQRIHQTNEELRVLMDISERQGRKIESLNDSLIRKNEILEKTNQELTTKTIELEEAMKRLGEMQNQLIQSEKLSSLGVLMAGIAHEINNPINYISNGLYGLKKALSQVETFSNEILARKEAAGDAIQEACAAELIEKYELGLNIESISIISGHIQTGINRILEIIGSLRQYTRSGSESFEAADLNAIADAALVMLFHEYKNRIEIIKTQDSLPHVECQIGKIHQLIVNILTNSIQAIPDKGQIGINTRYLPASDRVELIITDTGNGIDPSIRHKIFDPFFTTKKAGLGTGLGLSICYDIVQMHNGTISLKPGAENGTVCCITLPVHQPKRPVQHSKAKL